jgi:hypothetical protein
MTRYKLRKDANHAEITRVLEQIGCAVADLSRVGEGCPDLLVSRDGEQVLAEIKTERGKPTKPQLNFFGRWQGEIRTVRNVDDAIELAAWLRNQALLKTGHSLEKK